MNHVWQYLTDAEISALFQRVSLGVEREDHRITPSGHLAETPHPKRVDGTKTNHFIQRDFAESQLELVSPPVFSVDEMLDWLQAIHTVALRRLDDDERMWPFSMPPVIDSVDKIRVAQLTDRPEAIDYRNYLVKKYGKRLQMISGLHYNFGFSRAFIDRAYHDFHPELSRKEFQDQVYLKLAANMLRYQWLVIYLFGNAPYADTSFYPTPADAFTHPVRSIRNSHFGYHNTADVTVSYDSIEAYRDSLEANVRDHRLYAEKEYYATVRLRGGKNARAVAKNGIQYLEFRMFDIQGEEFVGITRDQALFMKYFALYLATLAERADDAAIAEGIHRAVVVSEEEPSARTVYYKEGKRVLSDMLTFVQTIAAPQHIAALVEQALSMLEHPEQTPAACSVKQYPSVSAWLEHGATLAQHFKAQALARPYALPGFTDMELSTQLLLSDVIAEGIDTEILDRADQFLRLRYQDHVEYVRKGNITSKDTYISRYLQANKQVTKRILQENGVPTPRFVAVHEGDDRTPLYWLTAKLPVVVKPKQTNYGIGISIFSTPPTAEELDRAIDRALEADDTALVEQYVTGTEYRFYVQEGRTLAVLLRVPANVVGDGTQTIAQLIAKRNQEPLRGRSHYTPLSMLEMGNVERETLAKQGYTFESVPKAGERVWLRENSNVSTGGSSIDVTDDIHESYKQEAEQIADMLGVTYTGLDMVITDRSKPAESDGVSANYTIIETNFNPMMMMHMYPEEGNGRPLTMATLRLLFPEKEMRESNE